MKHVEILLVWLGLMGWQTAWSEASDLQQPVLVHRTKECLVHVTPAVHPLIEDGNNTTIGRMLLLTTVENGEMKVLSMTGSWALPTRRLSYRQTRLVGVAGDSERLYALVWDSGRVDDRPPPASQPAKGGTYQLFVYWLGDGSTILSQPLSGDELPAEAPVETAKKGPLQLIDHGVSCYGTTIKFKGKQMVQ